MQLSERPVELEAILNEVRRRWMRRSLWRAAMLGSAAAATALFAGWAAVGLVAREGVPLLVATTIAVLIAAFALVSAFWALPRRPSDRQVARLVEERADGLDDVLATAVDYDARVDATPRMRSMLFADALASVNRLDVHANLDTILSRESVRAAGVRAAAAIALLALAAAVIVPSVSRATNVAAAYLFPALLTVDVTPGSTKVREGQSITITARIAGFAGEVVPTLTVAAGDEARAVRMTPGGAPGTFAVTIEGVAASFGYNVSAAKARSGDYTVTVIRPPRVERIDLHYEFPRGVGLEPRTDENSGDIFGPPGTRVRLAIVADKPIASAALVLDDGSEAPLATNDDAQSLDGALTIDDDGSYRIALLDHDGLESSGDTEYFIRTLNDRPPDVRILRPASDKHVTPLEEVHIEARADDDFGIASLDLVFQTPAGKERTVPLKGGGGLTASGGHTLFMEELGVQPGDFVTYYARARDVNRGRRSTEVRSDIFFLEVKPFEEEFVAAMSQQGGQGSGMNGGLGGLVDAQKQIIVATWNLDARARRARSAASQQDIKEIAKSQAELRERAIGASAQAARLNDPRRRRRTDASAPGDDPVGKAAEAMGRAVGELDKLSTSGAMPHEMEALNHLLRAEAENRRREVTRSQQAGGGGGQNRAEADLSSLFDQELRKRQQTNYEAPNVTEERQETPDVDPLERIRELARRQDALNRQQRDLERTRQAMEAEELKRQLERLTREQNDLRQQTQQLAKQMQSGQRDARGDAQEESRRLREISEDMRNASTGMRQQDAAGASQSGGRAAERLKDLEKQMQTSRPDERRRALGELQLETRQLADQQRRLANESSQTAAGQPGEDARRRLAGEQERLAERAERLEQQVGRMSQAGNGQQDERRATGEAARELERQDVPGRMRRSAADMRQGANGSAQQQDVAKALDRVAEQLSAASGTHDADERRASQGLARTQELRDKMQELDRSIERLRREGTPESSGSQEASRQAQGSQGPPGTQPQPGRGGTSGQGSGSSEGNGGERLEQMQRDVNEQMRQAQQLAEDLRRDNPGLQPATPDGSWWRSFSAPGTESFKQDFTQWESLKKNLLVALDDVETKLSGELRARQSSDRLNAGGHDAVSEPYRTLVEKYYRSLAAPRKQQ